jgi:hypothetical protein
MLQCPVGALRIPPLAVVMVVTVIMVAVVNRDNGVIIAVVEVFRGRRLVVVAVAVIDAHEATGFCRIAGPAVPRQFRIGADGA